MGIFNKTEAALHDLLEAQGPDMIKARIETDPEYAQTVFSEHGLFIHPVTGELTIDSKFQRIADEAQAARVEKIKAMTPAKIAPMAAYLLSDAANEVTGQIFGVRHNEIFLFSQNRPSRSVQRTDGWTPRAIAEHAVPAMKSHFTPLERSGDVFSWDPV